MENQGGGVDGFERRGKVTFHPCCASLSLSVSLFLCKGINEIFKSTGMCSNGELSQTVAFLQDSSASLTIPFEEDIHMFSGNYFNVPLISLFLYRMLIY